MSKPDSSRRQFMKTAGTASALAAAGLTTMKQLPVAANDSVSGLSCLDYRRSFICGTSDLNSVRFWIESRTTIVDSGTGSSFVFYQCASCKSENTFGDSDLFLPDNYDFLPIYGDGHWLIFRRHARLDTDRYREKIVSPNAWGEPQLLVHEGANVQVLETWDQIKTATAEGVPLVSQTELVSPDMSLKATIECPIKTMNISLEKEMYQVDTGPVAFPDLQQDAETMIERLQLAFVAFNQNDFADFVIEQPTPVAEDEIEVARIYHYSSPISLPATNRLLTHQ